VLITASSHLLHKDKGLGFKTDRDRLIFVGQE